MSLVSILDKYGSVDNHCGTDKNTTHSYGALYSDVFESRKHTTRTVLEIGVFSGASAVAWADYFGNATVDGVDITLDNVRFGIGHPRVTFHEMDATLVETRDRLLGSKFNSGYDIVIDDGSHIPEHQIRTFEIFGGCLRPGGVYVIEDIHEVHAEIVREKASAIAASHGLRMEWHDLRHKKNRFDDIVAFFYSSAA